MLSGRTFSPCLWGPSLTLIKEKLVDKVPLSNAGHVYKMKAKTGWSLTICHNNMTDYSIIAMCFGCEAAL